MTALNVQGRDYELMADSRLVDMASWNRDVAVELARREGMVLSGAHWEVIDAMRDFYQRYNISPVRKLLRKELAGRLGADRASDGYLARLFPGDVMVQGSRIAGIPLPMLDAELERTHYAMTRAPEPAAVSHFVSEFEFDGRRVQVYPRGNLVNPEDWNERLATTLARKEGIELSEEHWEVVRFLRHFYFQYGIAPMVKLLMTHMTEQYGPERASEAHLYGLFPGGPSRQGSRIAGLPEPQGCIDP